LQCSGTSQKYSGSALILGGDLNVDFSRVSVHSDFLNQFCTTNNICPVIRHELSTVDYTYNFRMQRFSTLDHFIISDAMFTNFVQSCVALHDGDNLSDHDPLMVKTEWDWKKCAPACKNNRVFICRPAWHKATSEHITLYKINLHCNLAKML